MMLPSLTFSCETLTPCDVCLFKESIAEQIEQMMELEDLEEVTANCYTLDALIVLCNSGKCSIWNIEISLKLSCKIFFLIGSLISLCSGGGYKLKRMMRWKGFSAPLRSQLKLFRHSFGNYPFLPPLVLSKLRGFFRCDL